MNDFYKFFTDTSTCFREKLKINAVSGQLDETFNDMLNKY